jgi:hypothetical protein
MWVPMSSVRAAETAALRAEVLAGALCDGGHFFDERQCHAGGLESLQSESNFGALAVEGVYDRGQVCGYILFLLHAADEHRVGEG